LRSERLSSGDAVHCVRLVFGQLPDNDFVRAEPQVPGCPKRWPDAHVTFTASRSSSGGLPVHATCSVNRTLRDKWSKQVTTVPRTISNQGLGLGFSSIFANVLL
jgi:hypothetical protein